MSDFGQAVALPLIVLAGMLAAWLTRSRRPPEATRHLFEIGLLVLGSILFSYLYGLWHDWPGWESVRMPYQDELAASAPAIFWCGVAIAAAVLWLTGRPGDGAAGKE